jgi:hypothetical protein
MNGTFRENKQQEEKFVRDVRFELRTPILKSQGPLQEIQIYLPTTILQEVREVAFASTREYGR